MAHIEIDWEKPEKTYNNIKDYFSFHGFSLQDGKKSIHDPKSVEIMTSIIKADSYVINILKEGLKLEFTQAPTPYEERNNKSAHKYIDQFRQKVNDWVSSGYVEKTIVKPFTVNPFTVVKQENSVSKIPSMYRPIKIHQSGH